MAYRNNEPYNDLPLLPPAALLETTAVLRRAITASRALAELKGAGNLIPNQAILINAIPLQEARLSSEIENIVTTQDALFRAATAAEGRVDPATREVLRYRTALRHGFEALRTRRIDIDLILEVCRVLSDGAAALRDAEPILIEDVAAGQAVYTPPRGRARIVALLRNLTDFLNGPGDLDPLLRMAVAHYQFEAIHPFVDGNGRTGRILNILALVQAGLLDIPVLYLSRYIIQNKPEYYRRLAAVTERGDWEGWLLYMLAAVEETARWTTGRIGAIRELFEATTERCRRELPEYMYSRELVELLFVQPYVKVKFLVDAGIAKRQTAAVYLRELEKLGILQGERHGRETVYKHPALLDLLSE
ncbi:MAG: Fic family protein [Anaerolineae bacterium]|nr:Fic family protein [Anaerolineae bacterium]